jgi:uncharacterized protein YggT (Ycf19 family)
MKISFGWILIGIGIIVLMTDFSADYQPGGYISFNPVRPVLKLITNFLGVNLTAIVFVALGFLILILKRVNKNKK